MDMLVTVGVYQGGQLEVPGLGYQLQYNSGTVIGIAGRVVRHGATADRQQLCWVQYLQDNVLNALDIEEPAWVALSDILSL